MGKNIIDTFISISNKAGIGLVIPKEIQSTCCGQIFSSKGFSAAYQHTVNDTVSKLWEWSQQGALPVVIDITSCTLTLQECGHALSPENKQKFDGHPPRHHGGDGNWGDLLIPVIVTQGNRDGFLHRHRNHHSRVHSEVD